ncbi:hypothetical protein H9P43_000805 [Blastocladiella emersonii ATCC 22665]|nr:hypothetical protein H9P43_000805 [Blastocladiella emersonii ATCC 22665]
MSLNDASKSSSISTSQLYSAGPVQNLISPWEEPKQCRIRVQLPLGQTTVIQVDFARTMREILQVICDKRSLDISCHVLLIQFDDGSEMAAEPDRRLSEYSDWKLFVVHSTKEADPSSPDYFLAQSTTNLSISGTGASPLGERASVRRRSVINAPTSKQISVRMDAEEFPRTVSDAAEIEARMERAAKGFAMGTTAGHPAEAAAGTTGTISKKSAMKAISTMLLMRRGPDTTAPGASGQTSSDELSPSTTTPPSGGSNRDRLSFSERHSPQRMGVIMNMDGVPEPMSPTGDSASHKSSSRHTLEKSDAVSISTAREEVMRKCDSEDIRVMTKRALFQASREATGSFSSDVPAASSSAAASNAPSPLTVTLARTSRPRTSNSNKYVTLRRTPTSSPSRAAHFDGGSPAPEHADADPVSPTSTVPPPLIMPREHIYESGPASPPLPSDAPADLVSVSVTLPNMLTLRFKVSEAVRLESLLAHICKTQKLAFAQYSLEIVCSNAILELDRPVKHYVDKEKSNAFNVVNKAKSYMSICVSENGTEVLVLKSTEGRLKVMAATQEKLIELLTLNTDLHELVGIPKPPKPPVSAMGMANTLSSVAHWSQVAPSSAGATGTPSTRSPSMGSMTLAALTSDIESDYDYELLDTFLMTYRSFMKPTELFDRVVAQFNAEAPEDATPEDVEFFERNKIPTQIRSVQALGIWVDHYWNDFALRSDLKNDLESFLAELCQFGQFRELSLAIQDIIERKTEEYERVIGEYKLASQKSKTMESMIMAYTPLQVAQQLCVYNWRLFRNIHPIEYLNQIWVKNRDEDSMSPSLDYFISRFDVESYWVATEVCMVKDMKKRAAVLTQFIEIAKHCLDMNNFFTTFSIFFGLNMGPVERLKKTWKLLTPDTQSKFEEVSKFCDASRNMKNYRDRLAEAKPPMVPFLPIYLKDLTFLNDGNDSMVRGMLNVDKLHMMSRRVQEIVLSRGTRYDVATVAQVQNYLKKPPTERELKKLKELSLELEPKEK